MNHNIVTDEDGNEHQAVEDVDFFSGESCRNCSLSEESCCETAPCEKSERVDGVEAIYKRRIKLSDIIIKN